MNAALSPAEKDSVERMINALEIEREKCSGERLVTELWEAWVATLYELQDGAATNDRIAEIADHLAALPADEWQAEASKLSPEDAKAVSAYWQAEIERRSARLEAIRAQMDELVTEYPSLKSQSPGRPSDDEPAA